MIRKICLLDQPRGIDEYFLASTGRLTYVAAEPNTNSAPCLANVAVVDERLILRRARSSAG